MPGAKVLTKAATSNAGKALATLSSTKEKSAASKTLVKRSVATRKVHEAPKTGSVSRAAAKSAVKKAIASRNMDSGKS